MVKFCPILLENQENLNPFLQERGEEVFQLWRTLELLFPAEKKEFILR